MRLIRIEVLIRIKISFSGVTYKFPKKLFSLDPHQVYDPHLDYIENHTWPFMKFYLMFQEN